MTNRRDELLDNLQTCEEMANSSAIGADRSAWLRLAEMGRRSLDGESLGERSLGGQSLAGTESLVNENLSARDKQ